MIPSINDINTLAGNGTAGFGGDGLLATNASVELDDPRAVAVDAAGNTYIADASNNRVRKVTASTGVISTVAGGGTGCAGETDSLGDGCQATSGVLNVPFGVALDSVGNIFIADKNNNVVRKVTASTGVISTVAGDGIGGFSGDNGLATSANMTPASVAVDSHGNIYIVDESSNRIRAVNTGASATTIANVTIQPGHIATVAGNGAQCSNPTASPACGDTSAATSAQLNSPEGVAVDASGNIFIADDFDNRIRKVVPSGTISTVAGNGVTGSGHCDSTELNSPSGVAVDATGELYIADYGNECVRKLSGSTLSVFAGSSTTCLPSTAACGDGGLATSADLKNPYAVAVDSNGNVYIADTGDNRIRIVGEQSILIPSTGQINTIAGNGTPGFSGDGEYAPEAELNNPQGVAVDSAGNLFIADTGNNRIRKVTKSTGVITTVAGNGTAGFSGDGSTATAAKLNGPSSVIVDSSGNLYIADTNNNRIRKVTSGGVISTVAGNGTAGFSGDGGAATSAELNGPVGVGLDSSGNIYVADTNNQRIRVVNTGSVQITLAGVSLNPSNIGTVAGDGVAGGPHNGFVQSIHTSLNFPRAVQGVVSGTLFYLADTQNCEIRRVDTATGLIDSSPAGSNQACGVSALNLPSDIVRVGSSNLVADTGNNVVREGPPASLSVVAGNGTAGFSGDGGSATSAELSSPNGVAVDSPGNIYIADTANSRIRVVGH